jgi:hypothetical protein
MHHSKELDEAELRLEFRRLYKEIGFRGCMTIVAEMAIGTRIMLEVLREEISNEKS